jgi:hypothetical protein
MTNHTLELCFFGTDEVLEKVAGCSHGLYERVVCNKECSFVWSIGTTQRGREKNYRGTLVDGWMTLNL